MSVYMERWSNTIEYYVHNHRALKFIDSPKKKNENVPSSFFIKFSDGRESQEGWWWASGHGNWQVSTSRLSWQGFKTKSCFYAVLS